MVAGCTPSPIIINNLIDSVANNRGPRAEILKYNVNVEPNLGPRLFATLSSMIEMELNRFLTFVL